MLRVQRRTAGAAVLSVALSGVFTAASVATPAVVGSDAIGGPALASTGVVVALGPGAAPLPKVAAKSWVLADLTTGEVLAAKDAHWLGRPASTLKTLTAVTLLPVLDKDAQHTVTFKEASADGGHVGIVPDASYSAWDLWHGLLLPSGNDAAAALAGAHGGMKRTVADMQAMAGRLQAGDTTVRNPSGLDADGQFTSAYDMALFAKAAMANEDFRTLTRTIRYDFPGRPPKAGKERKTYTIYTQNRLLLRGYKGTVGGKTGFTSKAGRTFWAAATRGGHTLVVTLLQIRQPTETAAESLLSWGFRNRASVVPVGTLVDPLPDGAVPGPAQSAPAPAGTAVAVGATSGAASSPAGADVPGWAWVLGLVIVAAGGVALVLGRGRRAEGPGTGPGPASHGPGDTVLPTHAPRAAARTSPSVVVSTPGRRVDVDLDGPADAVPAAAPLAPSPTAPAEAASSALAATGPVPIVTAPTPSTPSTPTTPTTPTVDTPVDVESGSPAADPPPAPSAPPQPAPGGNVRVIRPPGPGSA